MQSARLRRSGRSGAAFARVGPVFRLTGDKKYRDRAEVSHSRHRPYMWAVYRWDVDRSPS